MKTSTQYLAIAMIVIAPQISADTAVRVSIMFLVGAAINWLFFEPLGAK